MRKKYTVVSKLSVIAALLMVGLGVKPARADWVGQTDAQNYQPLNLSAAAANASISQQGPTSDSQTPASVSGTATQTFVWSDPNGNPAPTDSFVTHTIGLTGTLASTLTATGPSSVHAKKHVWDPGYYGTMDYQYSNSKTYDYYRTYSVVDEGTDTSPSIAQQSQGYDAVLGPDGIHYILSVSFSVQLQNSADIYSSYYFGNLGQSYNYGYGAAHVSAATATTSNIVAP